MLHILLLVLKIIGILLAVVLGLLLLVICVVLFVPVCYGAQIQFPDRMDGQEPDETCDTKGKFYKDISAKGKVSWLFGLIQVTFSLEDGKTSYSFRIAWKQMGDNKSNDSPVQKRKKQPKDGKTSSKQEARVEDTELVTPARSNETVEQKPVSDQKKVEEGPSVSKVNSKEFENNREKTCEKNGKKQKSLSVSKRLQKIKCTFERFCDKIKQIEDKKEKLSMFLKDGTHRKAFQKLKKEVLHLWKRLAPKRISGKVVFGFEDPSLTGKTLAWISVIYPWIGDHTDIQPNFERAVFAGELDIRGKLYVVHPTMTALRLLLCKAIRSSYHDVKAFNL